MKKLFLKALKLYHRGKHNYQYNELQKYINLDKKLKEAGLFNPINDIVVESSCFSRPIDSTYLKIANFLLCCGHHEIAEQYYKLSLEKLATPDTYSLYLQSLLMNPECSEEKLYKESVKYEKMFLSNVKKYNNFTSEPVLNKKLRVGYICHFFHNSVSKSMLLPFLQAHDADKFEIYCYSDTLKKEVESEITSKFKHWQHTKKLSDEELAELIRKDKIDILLELNGHCVVNRYGVIARKPCPIQICYYNQAGTTGLSTFDYNLFSKEVYIENPQKLYSEKQIYLLDGVSGVMRFPDNFPQVSQPPALKKGYITFGSFGASHKVNKQVIKMWCAVLKAVPTAKFYMKAGALSHDVFVKAYKKMFQDEGIDLSRVVFEGFSEHLHMLACYSKVDIALDTYPHAAGTTTMEAIWQGVPVLTFASKKLSSQGGKAILTSLGHPEFVSYTLPEFVDKAVKLASNMDQLVTYRNSLRSDFKKSPKADVEQFTRTLENAYTHF